MSDTVDKQRAVEREPDKWRRLELVFADLSRVARMKREGLPMSLIAQRLGWTEMTLYRWLAAFKVLERKGIKMTDGKQ